MKIDWKKVLKWLKIAGAAIVGILAAVLAVKTGKAIRRAVLGRVNKSTDFYPDPDDPHIITVRNEEGDWENFELPPGVKYRNVAAAEISPTGVTVEVIHEKGVFNSDGDVDPDGDSALDVLRRRCRPQQGGD